VLRKYRVEIGPGAEHDICSIRDHIAEDNPRAALRWVARIRGKIKSLAQLPERSEVIPEAPELGVNHRHLIVGNHRIIYLVEPSRVLVVRVLNAAQILKPHMLRDR
jgi:plasmid stabilization system protein ParE